MNMVSKERFMDWLTGAQKGSQLVYHSGMHAFGEACHAAMSASDAGLVCLTQRAVKTSTGLRKFEYIATRTMNGVRKKK